MDKIKKTRNAISEIHRIMAFNHTLTVNSLERLVELVKSFNLVDVTRSTNDGSLSLLHWIAEEISNRNQNVRRMLIEFATWLFDHGVNIHPELYLDSSPIDWAVVAFEEETDGDAQIEQDIISLIRLYRSKGLRFNNPSYERQMVAQMGY